MNYRGRYSSGGGFGFGPGISPTVKYLIMANVILFLLDSFLERSQGISIARLFGLVPRLFWHGMFWQPVSYMFLHGGFIHLLFNMFVLWMFGGPLESVWGSKRFTTYYFICGIGAGVLNAAIMPNSPIPTVGASGAIYGLLLAFGMMFPEQMIFLWFLFPIRAKYFVIIIGGIELFTALSQPNSPVAHFAHLGGMLFGFIYLKWHIIRGKTHGWTSNRESRRKIRIVWSRNEEMHRLQKEVDELLDKINEHGIESLTPGEIRRLKEASAKLKEYGKDLGGQA